MNTKIVITAAALTALILPAAHSVPASAALILAILARARGVACGFATAVGQ